MDPTHAVAHFLAEPLISDIVKINVRLATDGTVILRGIGTCVSAVKTVLGIRAWYILTPLQLRRYLLGLGGLSMKP